MTSTALTHPRPNLPPAPTGVDLRSVANFLAVFMRREPGAAVEWGTLYDGLVWLWSHQCPWDDSTLPSEPPTAAAFGASLAYICSRIGISIKVGNARALCLGVRYIGHPRCGACGGRL